jgi:hypothetical protein
MGKKEELFMVSKKRMEKNWTFKNPIKKIILYK